MKILVDQMKLRKGLLIGGTAILVGVFIFGVILHDMIQVATDADDVFPMGGFLGLMGLAMIALLFVGQDFWQAFNHAVSMSQTRKRIVPAYIISYAVCQVVFVLVLKILIEIERIKLAVMYPTLPYDSDFSVIFSWKVFFFIGVVCIGTGIFLGGMLLKFGKAAYVAIYIFWMLVCIGVPKLMEYSSHHENSVLGRMMRSVKAVFDDLSLGQISIAVIAINVALIAIVWLVLRKQAVSN